jgi:hypothetical protein
MPEVWRKDRKDNEVSESMAYDHVKDEWLPASEVPKRHYFAQTQGNLTLFEVLIKNGNSETEAAIAILETLTKKEREAM